MDTEYLLMIRFEMTYKLINFSFWTGQLVKENHLVSITLFHKDVQIELNRLKIK